MNNKIKTLLAAGALVVGAQHGQANTITPQLVGWVPGSAITYAADLTSGEMHPGDGFTIFDIGGFVGFGAIAPGWVAASSAVGSPFSPPGPLGPDAGAANVHFTYIGPAVEVVLGAATFTPFVVLTTSTALTTDNWVSKDHLIGAPGVIDGALGPGDRGNILVPVGVPDGGATAMLLGLGFLGAAGLRRKLS